MTFNEISAPSVREIFVRCYKPICRIEAHGKDKETEKGQGGFLLHCRGDVHAPYGNGNTGGEG